MQDAREALWRMQAAINAATGVQPPRPKGKVRHLHAVASNTAKPIDRKAARKRQAAARKRNR